ncbi:YqhR family membrane protein [Paenibacillus arenosi]|uniref:Uncharacterized protein n=1 Tax=Paenibacillus arenosi TaxID=2774142 RepID=A0ABR9AX29_9BACL|nr:hypothetical protein [Paenibacillus arenosi]
MTQHQSRNKQNQQNQQNDQPKTNPWWFALQLGFYAGLIWGGMRILSYELHFTVNVPGFLLEPFLLNSFLQSQQGRFAGWGAFILFSILCSLLYTFTMRKRTGPWPGILYGILWWVLLFVAVGPALGLVLPVTQTSYNSITTELCIFLLWGLFIGYTAATEFNDERLREPENEEESASDDTAQAAANASS